MARVILSRDRSRNLYAASIRINFCALARGYLTRLLNRGGEGISCGKHDIFPVDRSQITNGGARFRRSSRVCDIDSEPRPTLAHMDFITTCDDGVTLLRDKLTCVLHLLSEKPYPILSLNRTVVRNVSAEAEVLNIIQEVGI